MNELQVFDNLTEEIIVEHLSKFIGFESFFVEVCKLKNALDGKELNILTKAVDKFNPRFSVESIVYLNDCVHCEQVLFARNRKKGDKNA